MKGGIAEIGSIEECMNFSLLFMERGKQIEVTHKKNSI